MEPARLLRQLQDRGVGVLWVARHRKTDVLAVHIRGGWGLALIGARVIAEVPGVVSVTPSVHAPSILLVHVESQQVQADAKGSGGDATRA